MGLGNGAGRFNVARPIETIQIICSLALLVVGLYIISPYYQSVPGATAVMLFNTNIGIRYSVGVFAYILPSLPLLATLLNKKWATVKMYEVGNMLVFVSFLFTTILRLLTVGPRPFVWVYPLALGLIAGACRLYWKAEE